jgi:hypothetical protein
VRVATIEQVPSKVLRLITAIAESTTTEVKSFLPELRNDWLLWFRVGNDVIPETGEVGISLAPGLVQWIADTEQTATLTELAERQLRFTLFHELHHQVRGWVVSGGPPNRTLMDSVVAEGLATAFARDTAGHQAPWADYPDNVRDWATELQSVSRTVASADHRQWMIRHADGRRWIGYRAGTYICDQVTARSGSSAADLVSQPTGDILALAGLAEVAN